MAPFVSELRVRYSETDKMGVVYHAEYLVWCEVGRTDYIRSRGLPYAELERRGTALAVAEANAAGVASGDSASIVAWRSGGSARRRLVTERDVVALARSGGRIPDGALLTPSARDRAVALGLIAR